MFPSEEDRKGHIEKESAKYKSIAQTTSISRITLDSKVNIAFSKSTNS